MEKIQALVKAHGLTLHPDKTRIVDAQEPGGFDFLGYHFERGMKWPRQKSLDKLKEAIRAKTRRTEGRSLKAICEDLNGALRGWFEYFKHSQSKSWRQSTATCEADCEASCASVTEATAEAEAAIISAGPTPTSTRKACFP